VVVTGGGKERYGVYTSPSIKYSELDIYAKPTHWRGHKIRVVLQCRQNLKIEPPALRIIGETIGWHRRFGDAAISPHFPNDKIERCTSAMNSVIPYRILVGMDVVTREDEEKTRKEEAEKAEKERKKKAEEERRRKEEEEKARKKKEEEERRRKEEEAFLPDFVGKDAPPAVAMPPAVVVSVRNAHPPSGGGMQTPSENMNRPLSPKALIPLLVPLTAIGLFVAIHGS